MLIQVISAFINGAHGNVEIGGVNLLKSSSPSVNPYGWYRWNNQNEICSIENGYAVNDKWVGNYLSILTPLSNNPVLENGKYTINYIAYADSKPDDTSNISIGFYNGSTGSKFIEDKVLLENVPTKHVYHFELTEENNPGNNWSFGLLWYNNSAQKPTNKLHIKDIKLEHGDAGTGWCPATEDIVMRSELEDVNNRIGSFEKVWNKRIIYAQGDEIIKITPGIYIFFFAQGGSLSKYGMYFIRKTDYKTDVSIKIVGTDNVEVTFSEDYSSLVIKNKSEGNFDAVLYKIMAF